MNTQTLKFLEDLVTSYSAKITELAEEGDVGEEEKEADFVDIEKAFELLKRLKKINYYINLNKKYNNSNSIDWNTIINQLCSGREEELLK